MTKLSGLRRLPGRRYFLAAAGVLIFLVSIYRLSLFVNPNAGFPESPETIRTALALAYTGRFADPFYPLPTGPTAHVPPLFPAMAAALLKAADYRWGVVLQWAAVLKVSFLLSLFPVTAQRLGLGWASGLVAAVFWLMATPVLYPRFEAQLAALGSLLLTLAAANFLGAPSRRSAVLLGCAGAAAALTQPSCLPVIAAILALGAVAARRQAVLAALVFFALLVPWTVRNRLALGAWIPLRSNLGLELAVANADCAKFSFRLNYKEGCMRLMHPNVNPSEALLVREMGEAVYNRTRLAAAWSWIRSHPGTFASLTLRRVLAFWIPHENEDMLDEFRQPGFRLHRLFQWTLTPVSFAGLVLLWKASRTGAFLLGAWLALYPLVYYLLQADDRYRFPILWVSYLLGSYFLMRLAGRLAVRLPAG